MSHRKIKIHFDDGTARPTDMGYLEVPEDADDEEIDEAVEDIVFNKISWSWSNA